MQPIDLLNTQSFNKQVEKVKNVISKPGMEVNSFLEPIYPYMYRQPVLMKGKEFIPVALEGITSVTRISKR